MANYGQKAIDTENGLVYESTGEVVNKTGRFKSDEQIEQQKEYLKRSQERELKRKEENKNYPKIEENFIWQYYTQQKNIYPELKPQDVTMLVFVSTFCEFNTNALIDGNTYIKKNKLLELTRVSKKRFYEWYDKMIDMGYLKEKDDRIILNRNFFNRGMMQKEKNATRIFTDIFRNLYENVDVKDHHKIGKIMALIPFLNPYFNVLSTNIQETDKDKLQRMKISDLAEVLGIEKSHARRLANDLLSIRFGINKTPLIALVAIGSLDVSNMYIVMNHKLVFGGNLQQYKEAEKLFNNRLLEIENLF